MALRKAAKEKGNGKNAPRRGSATNVYEDLVNAPDTRIGESPISRLAEQAAVDPICFDWNAPHTDRIWTNRQGHLRLYKHRFFTTGQALTQDNLFFLRRVSQFLLYCVPAVCPCICLVEPAAGF